jgi:hypothetical protein
MKETTCISLEVDKELLTLLKKIKILQDRSFASICRQGIKQYCKEALENAK